MKSLMTIVVVLLMVATPSAGWSAVTIEGVSFDSSCVEANQKLNLRGAGLFRYMKFIKAYAGALYLPESVPSREVLTDVPKRLEVSYFHGINGEDFGAATISGIRKNVDQATFERIRTQVEYHNSLYRDVKPGDRYALTYIPGRGTSLSLNGQELGVIEGAEFASALFSIWLGKAPANKYFKKELLGKG